MRERRSEVESAIARLETDIAGHEAALSVFVSMDETKRVTTLLERARSSHQVLLAEWEKLSVEIEESEG